MSKLRHVPVIAALLLATLPITAHATTFQGKIKEVVYGVEPGRYGVIVRPTGGACPSARPQAYVFNNNAVWAQAFLDALKQNLTVFIAGNGTCDSHAVEGISYFRILTPAP